MAPNKLLLILFTIIMSTAYARAQEATWELGLSGGAAGYMGDLNQNNPLSISGISAGLYAKRNFNQYLGLRVNYTYGRIQAKDSQSSNAQFVERNLAFKTSLNEFSALLDLNLFDFKLGGGNRFLSPYLFAGAGLLVFKPTFTWDGETYRLDRMATEGQESGYKNAVLTIPYGIGIRYNYKDTWCVFTEIGYRTPMTDYLDDVSGKYPDVPVVIGNQQNPYNLSDPSLNKIGVAGTQRGDFRKRDTYLFVSVGISFTFVTSKCYSF
ncbi:DUF6089 family protein [Pedobacter sp. AW1-32]|uniref:type IX secretion system protein PorG n=1 Tax=Pedobacter sp. AW1-32 TaxID=3383026 RepID=UPI003FEE5DD6